MRELKETVSAKWSSMSRLEKNLYVLSPILLFVFSVIVMSKMLLEGVYSYVQTLAASENLGDIPAIEAIYDNRYNVILFYSSLTIFLAVIVAINSIKTMKSTLFLILFYAFKVLTCLISISLVAVLVSAIAYKYIFYWVVSIFLMTKGTQITIDSVNLKMDSIFEFTYTGMLLVVLLTPLVVIALLFETFLDRIVEIKLRENAYLNMVFVSLRNSNIETKIAAKHQRRYHFYLHFKYLMKRIFVLGVGAIILSLSLLIASGTTTLVVNKCEIYNNLNNTELNNHAMFSQTSYVGFLPISSDLLPFDSSKTPKNQSLDNSGANGLLVYLFDQVQNSSFVINAFTDGTELKESCASPV